MPMPAQARLILSRAFRPLLIAAKISWFVSSSLVWSSARRTFRRCRWHTPGLPYKQGDSQTAQKNWATLTYWAKLHPREPPSELGLSYWATLHSPRLRCILLSKAASYSELGCTLPSYTAPSWAALLSTYLRRTLLSYAAPSGLHCTLLS